MTGQVASSDRPASSRTNSNLRSRAGPAASPRSIAGYLLLSPTLIAVAVLTVAPLGYLAIASFWRKNGLQVASDFSLENYHTIVAPAAATARILGLPLPFESPIYLGLILKSVVLSLVVTAIVLLLAYPMAYFVAFRANRNKTVWLILVTAPFWTSYLLRVFAWKIILGSQGVINSTLMSLGLISSPLEFLLYSPAAVVIALVHAWAAFAVLPIFVSLEKIDRSLLEAASNLGDPPMRTFLRVTFPLSLSGVISAALMVFIPTVGEYFTPLLVGGTSGVMVGNLIQSLFTRANNPPLGAALSIVMMLCVTVIAVLAVRLWPRSSLKMAR